LAKIQKLLPESLQKGVSSSAPLQPKLADGTTNDTSSGFSLRYLFLRYHTVEARIFVLNLAEQYLHKRGLFLLSGSNIHRIKALSEACVVDLDPVDPYFIGCLDPRPVNA
jgi:hypothetical protein